MGSPSMISERIFSETGGAKRCESPELCDGGAEANPHADDASVNFYRRRAMPRKAKKAAKKKAKKK
jgi:hypothetical protein